MSLSKEQSRAQNLSMLESLDQILGASPEKAHPLKVDDPISKIKLSESDIGNVLESVVPGYKTKANTSAPKAEPVQKKIESVNHVDRIQDLVTKLTSLLSEAKTVIAEMTSCGMIGTNQKFVLGAKKKKKLKAK